MQLGSTRAREDSSSPPLAPFVPRRTPSPVLAPLADADRESSAEVAQAVAWSAAEDADSDFDVWDASMITQLQAPVDPPSADDSSVSEYAPTEDEESPPPPGEEPEAKEDPPPAGALQGDFVPPVARRHRLPKFDWDANPLRVRIHALCLQHTASFGTRVRHTENVLKCLDDGELGDLGLSDVALQYLTRNTTDFRYYLQETVPRTKTSPSFAHFFLFLSNK